MGEIEETDGGDGQGEGYNSVIGEDKTGKQIKMGMNQKVGLDYSVSKSTDSQKDLETKAEQMEFKLGLKKHDISSIDMALSAFDTIYADYKSEVFEKLPPSLRWIGQVADTLGVVTTEKIDQKQTEKVQKKMTKYIQNLDIFDAELDREMERITETGKKNSNEKGKAEELVEVYANICTHIIDTIIDLESDIAKLTPSWEDAKKLTDLTQQLSEQESKKMTTKAKQLQGANKIKGYNMAEQVLSDMYTTRQEWKIKVSKARQATTFVQTAYSNVTIPNNLLPGVSDYNTSRKGCKQLTDGAKIVKKFAKQMGNRQQYTRRYTKEVAKIDVDWEKELNLNPKNNGDDNPVALIEQSNASLESTYEEALKQVREQNLAYNNQKLEVIKKRVQLAKQRIDYKTPN